MLNSTRRLGVVLFQLGGPDTPEAIEPFLFNLFSDPDIIDFPGARIARKPLAMLISATRARKVQRHYANLGGASPIRRFTEDQARALELKLRNSGIDAHCFVAMRYWHPFTVEAIERLRASRCDDVVLLPLYPHYSSTTTGSSLNEWRRLFHEDIPVHVVEPFYNHSLFLQAIVEKVNEVLARMTAPDRVDLVFSAHSVPLYVVERGDPYRRHIEHCVELVMSLGGWRNRHRLCYQSKVGAARWLQPSLHQTLKTIATENVREVCVVPISFVSDHVETLGELHHEARLEAAHLGIERFEVTSGLNTSPTFIEALAELVQNALKPASSEAKRLEDGMLTAAD